MDVAASLLFAVSIEQSFFSFSGQEFMNAKLLLLRHFWLCSAIALLVMLPATTSAHLVIYDVTLDGASENPMNGSPGTGTGTVTFDLDLITMRVEVNFTGLTGTVTNSHIHAPAAGAAFDAFIPGVSNTGVATPLPTFPGFPAGVTSGSYDETFDLTLASSYNPAFVTANGGSISNSLNALLAAASTNRAYLNIHTSTFGGGEIRGFLTAVPEPSGFMLLGLTLASLTVARRRKPS